MTEGTFLTGRFERVFFRLGSFSGEDARQRFVKAPFDIVKVSGKDYIMPGSSYACGRREDLVGILDQEEGNESDLGQQFFFDSLERIVLERHEMGNWQSNKENWHQVHCFGIV